MFDLDCRYSCYQSFFRTQQLVFPNLSLLFWVLGFWPISPLLHTQFPESKRKKVNHLGKRSCRIFQISEQLWPFQTKNSKEQNKAGNFWQKKDSSPLTARPFDDVNPDARILTPLPPAWSLTPLISNAPIFKDYTQKTFILAICLTLTLISITLL